MKKIAHLFLYAQVSFPLGNSQWLMSSSRAGSNEPPSPGKEHSAIKSTNESSRPDKDQTAVDIVCVLDNIPSPRNPFSPPPQSHGRAWKRKNNCKRSACYDNARKLTRDTSSLSISQLVRIYGSGQARSRVQPRSSSRMGSPSTGER